MSTQLQPPLWQSRPPPLFYYAVLPKSALTLNIFRLTPINYQISYDAYKEFVDAQGVTQAVRIPKITILVSHKTTEYTIKDLSPFTTYHVNVSAIPEDRSYRPPAKITVTTQV